jgi:hypothetical protein
VIAAERIQWRYSRNEAQQQKQLHAWEYRRQVDSAMVSPIIKSLPDDGPYGAETCCKLEKHM